MSYADKLMLSEETVKDRSLEIIRQVQLELQKEIEVSEKDAIKAEELVRLNELAMAYQGADKIVSFEELAKLIAARPPEPKLMSGFKDLDEILDGFRPKQVVVLTGPTKNGKTAFSLQLTTSLKEYNPVWFPFEEPAEELIQKFLERGDEIPHGFTPEKMLGNTLLWIEKKIVEAKAKFDSKVVFIDHLHFIVPLTAERQDLLIGHTMRELKRIAKLWNVTIFLIAHLKKTKMENNPDLEDIRDSSFIAQEADTVIMVWRKSERDKKILTVSNDVIVSVLANRRTGKTGSIGFEFINNQFVPKEISLITDDDDDNF